MGEDKLYLQNNKLKVIAGLSKNTGSSQNSWQNIWIQAEAVKNLLKQMHNKNN